MGKKVFFLPIAFFVLLSCTACVQHGSTRPTRQDKKLIEEVTKIIREKSLFTDSLDWKQIGHEVNALPFGPDEDKNHQMIFDFFTKTLRNAGDKHTFFMSERFISSYEKKHRMELPEGTYLGSGIARIKVPGCFEVDKGQYEAFANAIRHQVEKIDTSHVVTGWVVDLRGNGGGNMWPMLAGLNALTKDGVMGYFVTKGVKVPWKVSNGKLSVPPAAISPYKIKDPHVKIAVLIDSLTASSGEMTVISFLGLPNVKVFGRPSAGFTTANCTFNLSDGSMLCLAVTFSADRTSKIYPGKIIPDVMISNTGNPGDATLAAAEKWLRQ